MEAIKYIVALTKGTKTTYYYAYEKAQVETYLSKKWAKNAKVEVAHLKVAKTTHAEAAQTPGMWEEI